MMEVRTIRAGLQRVLQIARPTARPLCLRPRTYATTTTSDRRTPDDVVPSMSGFSSGNGANTFDSNFDEAVAAEEVEGAQEEGEETPDTRPRYKLIADRGDRVVPSSPSYFTALPSFTDALLRVEELSRRHSALPTLPVGEQPRTTWLTYELYKQGNAEPVRNASYVRLLKILDRLNQIHPAVMPKEVTRELELYKRKVQTTVDRTKPILVDQWGRARAVGRRKTSSAVVWCVEGEGEVRVNGKTLADFFPRLHDRESAVWPLKATGRLGLYNVWAVAKGGGTTGQAEAMTLGLAKSLLAHEPGLKPVLRRAGCVTRDTREVERKKAGKLKARKMPAWVKR